MSTLEDLIVENYPSGIQRRNTHVSRVQSINIVIISRTGQNPLRNDLKTPTSSSFVTSSVKYYYLSVHDSGVVIFNPLLFGLVKTYRPVVKSLRTFLSLWTTHQTLV